MPTIVKDETGKKDVKKSKRGIACKWAITDGYDLWLEFISPRVGEASFVDTESRIIVPNQGKGKNLKPTPCFLREIIFWKKANEACDLLYAA